MKLARYALSGKCDGFSLCAKATFAFPQCFCGTESGRSIDRDFSVGVPRLMLRGREYGQTHREASAALDIVEIMQRRHFRLYDGAFGTDRAYRRNASPIHRLTAAPTLLL